MIGSGTKIDNQVMVAHNCVIGKHNVFANSHLSIVVIGWDRHYVPWVYLTNNGPLTTITMSVVK